MSTLAIRGLRVSVHTEAGPKEILKGVDLTVRSGETHAIMYTFVKSSLVFTDPPDHTRLRRLVIAAFVPSVINELAGPIGAITNRMLDEHADSLDLAAHLAEPMPIAVLGQLLGVSLSETEGAQLKRWCDDFLLPFGRDINTLSSGSVLG